MGVAHAHVANDPDIWTVGLDSCGSMSFISFCHIQKCIVQWGTMCEIWRVYVSCCTCFIVELTHLIYGWVIFQI